jgi:hypothetical protein
MVKLVHLAMVRVVHLAMVKLVHLAMVRVVHLTHDPALGDLQGSIHPTTLWTTALHCTALTWQKPAGPQSRNCCSLRLIRSPLLDAHMPSIEPVAGIQVIM